MNKQLIILVGNIGAGKSTLVKQFQKAGCVVIARDMLRYAIGGGNYVFNYDYEPIIWETELKMLQSFLDLGCNIVIDEVGVSKSMRTRYLDIIKIYYPDYYVRCIVMPKISKKESVKRRLKNPHGQPNKKMWEEVWSKFNRMYEEPSYDEGFNEIIKL